MSDETINISLDSVIKGKLEEKFAQYGFTDSKQAIQYLLDGIANGNIDFVEQLDDETARRVIQSRKEIEAGDSYSLSFTDPVDINKIFGE